MSQKTKKTLTVKKEVTNTKRPAPLPVSSSPSEAEESKGLMYYFNCASSLALTVIVICWAAGQLCGDKHTYNVGDCLESKENPEVQVKITGFKADKRDKSTRLEYSIVGLEYFLLEDRDYNRDDFLDYFIPQSDCTKYNLIRQIVKSNKLSERVDHIEDRIELLQKDVDAKGRK